MSNWSEEETDDPLRADDRVRMNLPIAPVTSGRSANNTRRCHKKNLLRVSGELHPIRGRGDIAASAKPKASYLFAALILRHQNKQFARLRSSR
jgi:hypothetical protein